MDVSALLNAAPVDAIDHDELQRTCPSSPKRSSSSTPTLAIVHHVEEPQGSWGDAGHGAGTLPLPHRPGMAEVDLDAYWRRFGGREMEASQRSWTLDGGQRLDGHGGGYAYQGPLGTRLHRFSDSQSSTSSYESTASQPHSRTSSVTTVGDEGTASVSYADILDETKLATVQEETSMRASSRSNEQRMPGRPRRPALVVNTDNSKRRTSRREPYSRSFSNLRGVKAPGGLSVTGCTPLPTAPAYGSSSSQREDQHAQLATMDRSHRRVQSVDSADGSHTYLSQPGTPQSAFSYINVTTPGSAASVDSPAANSASTSDAVVGRPIPSIPGTPTRASRRRTETVASASTDLDQPCFAQEDCTESSVNRKAISHFFGRNKKCTLLIPAEVWINICRKHYQRTRYRNAERYPMYQIDLIRKQIDKIERWETSFIDKGQSSPIKGWTIALRKRQNATSSLNVPAWLLQASGPGHTTDSIKMIAQRIEAELIAKMYTDIPEIEFLPDITSGVAPSPARRERKQHVRRTSSISSGYVGGLSRSSSMDVNIGGRKLAGLHLGDDNAYYQDTPAHAQRSAANITHPSPAFKTEEGTSHQPGSLTQLSMPPPDFGSHHGNSGFRSEHASSGNSYVPASAGTYPGSTTSDTYLGRPTYSGYGSANPFTHGAQLPRDNLPSFHNGFGPALASKVKEEHKEHGDVYVNPYQDAYEFAAHYFNPMQTIPGRSRQVPFSSGVATPVPATPANSPHHTHMYGTNFNMPAHRGDGAYSHPGPVPGQFSTANG